MLRDGKFIKEPPIKIGAHYVPFNSQQTTREDEFVQHLILLGNEPTKGSATPRSAKILDWLMFLLMIWIGVASLVPLMKFIADQLL